MNEYPLVPNLLATKPLVTKLLVTEPIVTNPIATNDRIWLQVGLQVWLRISSAWTIASLCGTWIALPGFAQVQPDASFGSTVEETTAGLVITGGSRAENSRVLFHSFDRFSIPTEQTVIFQTPVGDLDDIFARVTGTEASQLEGTLRVEGNANLFLINPHGIHFGAGAALDLRGAFVGTTAQEVWFDGGAVLNTQLATAPPTLLTLNGNVGFRLTEQSGTITALGNGHKLRFNADFSTNRTARPNGVAVDPGQALVLLGNGITLNGANLTAAGGHIELGSVRQGTIVLPLSNLTDPVPNWSLIYDEPRTIFNDILLTQQASVDGSGAGGGFVQLYGSNLNVLEDAVILADTLGTENGQSLRLRGTESVSIVDGAPLAFASSLFTAIDPLARGNGGNLQIVTPQLLVSGGAIVGVDTFGAGNAGTLVVEAGDIELRQADWSVQTFRRATGNAGTIQVTANRFRITEGGQVLARTLGAGNAGNIFLQIADVLEVTGERTIFNRTVFSSLLSASVQAGSTGDRGTVTIEAGSVRVLNGGRISLETDGVNLNNRAGLLSITATKTIELGGTTSTGVPSSISSSTTSLAPGGELQLQTPLLFIQGGSQISAGTFGAGEGGNLSVTADQIWLQGVAPAQERVPSNFFRDETLRFFPSGLVAGSRGTGNGGDLQIQAGQILLQDGAQLTVGSTASGGAGTLEIQADRLDLQGASSLRGDSQAGLGNIRVTANQLLLNNSQISTNTRGNQPGGNIELTLAEILGLRFGSTIAANSTGTEAGGNIQMNTPILIALENSDITANAANNRGGSQTIRAQAILGTEFRPALTELSDITASSDLGAQLSGTVDILTPSIDFSSGLISLSETPVDPSNALSRGCAANQGNRFSVVGRGGLPEDPRQFLQGSGLIQDPRLALPAHSLKPSVNATKTAPGVPQEASSWYTDTQDQIHLIGASQIDRLFSFGKFTGCR